MNKYIELYDKYSEDGYNEEEYDDFEDDEYDNDFYEDEALEDTLYDEEVLDKLVDFIINSKYKNIVCYADSFGADYLGISGYYENMSADTEVIRISTGDLPTPLIKEVIEEFMQWLEVYL